MNTSRRSFLGGLAALAAAVAIPFKVSASAVRSAVQRVPIFRSHCTVKMPVGLNVARGSIVAIDPDGTVVPYNGQNVPIGFCVKPTFESGKATISISDTIG